jgi:hypothetical protein
MPGLSPPLVFLDFMYGNVRANANGLELANYNPPFN